MRITTHLYPQAKEQQRRLSSTNPTLRDIRFNFFKLAALNFIILQLLFFCLFCYIFGSLFQQTSHVHNLTVAFVDYDGGIIGTSVRQAYQQLQGAGFPALIELSPLKYSHPSDLEKLVCRIDYWAALYVSPGASNRLANGLTGGEASSSYNRSDVLSFFWNEARYSTTVDTVAVDLRTLTEAARIVYSGTGAMQTVPKGNAAAVSVFSNPWELTSLNLQPTTQGSRLIYNTLVIILVVLQEFFYLGTINGLYAQFKLYGRIPHHRIMVVRLCISLSYTFVGSLCTTGMIWAFRSGWDVNGNQFVLTWMSFWLFAHLNFLTFDVFSIWLPPPFVPMALITWIVLNITSILLPFALSPGFYRWAYALPTHALYNLLIDIWSRGCNPTLAYALPVMFAFELSSLALCMLGVYRRSHFGFLALENEERSFREKIAESLAKAREGSEEIGTLTRRTSQERAEEERAVITGGESVAGVVPHAEPVHRLMNVPTEADREEMAGRIWRETTQLRQKRSHNDNAKFVGPCFDLTFSN
jgi:hypothetical protein